MLSTSPLCVCVCACVHAFVYVCMFSLLSSLPPHYHHHPQRYWHHLGYQKHLFPLHEVRCRRQSDVKSEDNAVRNNICLQTMIVVSPRAVETRDWPDFPLEALWGCKWPHLQAQDWVKIQAKASAPPFAEIFTKKLSRIKSPVIKHLVDHFSCLLSGCSLNKPGREQSLKCMLLLITTSTSTTLTRDMEG